MLQGKTKDFQRNTNLALVLSTIKQSRGISRIEIANKLGLNRSTITYIVTQLIEQQVVYNKAEGNSAVNGGRKPVYVDLNPSYGCILGVEVQVHACRFILLDFTGTIIHSRTIELSPELNTLEEKFYHTFTAAKQIADSMRLPLIGAGVGIPGQVNPYSGRIIESYSLKIKNYDFFKQIASQFDIPILIDNDANCCAYGELFAKKGKDPKNFLYILPKYNTDSEDYRGVAGATGIGIGIVVNNEIYYGDGFLAGEFRSVYWNRKSREQVGIDTEELARISTSNEVLKKFIRELCFNLSVIISILNPGRVYLGGDICKDFSLVKSIILEEFSDAYVAQEYNGCEFLPADYNEYDAAAGAAYMFLERLFSPPEVRRIETYYSLNWDSVFSRLRKQQMRAEKDVRISV